MIYWTTTLFQTIQQYWAARLETTAFCEMLADARSPASVVALSFRYANWRALAQFYSLCMSVPVSVNDLVQPAYWIWSPWKERCWISMRPSYIISLNDTNGWISTNHFSSCFKVISCTVWNNILIEYFTVCKRNSWISRDTVREYLK